jgi:uncharacterized protein
VVLIGYNWPRNTDRFRRLQRFVEAFFPRIAEFQNAPNHPKWREVNLGATVRGWKRFEPAEDWLAAAQRAYAAEMQAKIQPASLAPRSAVSAAHSDRLFQEFLKWKQSQQNR